MKRVVPDPHSATKLIQQDALDVAYDPETQTLLLYDPDCLEESGAHVTISAHLWSAVVRAINTHLRNVGFKGPNER